MSVTAEITSITMNWKDTSIKPHDNNFMAIEKTIVDLQTQLVASQSCLVMTRIHKILKVYE